MSACLSNTGEQGGVQNVASSASSYPAGYRGTWSKPDYQEQTDRQYNT